ncbi:group II truncated hemoglobin [Agaribacterium haliotis]|uniref:group II truncated hemoglobin n=1 Tax=Agaribacterium haliotis TaxID=2013869 RepID=UPI000BB55023|nr:group II truncated hemoglobin [Agaribacterium haliotis]
MSKSYGTLDASYRAAGELAGISKLVDAFYDYMQELPEARGIRAMHPEDLTESRTKLTYFLSGWLGGPRLYKEHYGSIAIPRAHSHLAIGAAERDAWMLCMEHALDEQDYDKDFKRYMLEQLYVPAERCRQACAVSRRDN